MSCHSWMTVPLKMKRSHWAARSDYRAYPIEHSASRPRSCQHQIKTDLEFSLNKRTCCSWRVRHEWELKSPKLLKIRQYVRPLSPKYSNVQCSNVKFLWTDEDTVKKMFADVLCICDVLCCANNQSEVSMCDWFERRWKKNSTSVCFPKTFKELKNKNK